MRLLDRYLLRELLVPLVYCLTLFMVFWVAFDLFSQLADFQKAGLGGGDILRYYALTLPGLLDVVLPVSLLLALLYALTNHARHHELTAMRAAGVSLWRIAVPYLGVGVAFSLLLFAIDEVWLPDNMQRAQELFDGRQGVRDRTWREQLIFQNTAENRSWNIGSYHLKTGRMLRPAIVWRKADGARMEIYSDSAEFAGGAWIFSNAQVHVYSNREDVWPDRAKTNRLVITEFRETPDLIRSEVKVSSLNALQAAKRPQLTLREIRDYRALHPRPDRNMRAIVGTQFHARLAKPWTSLVVVLIALPFGAPGGRRNVFVGVASSIFICFGYFILQRLGLTLGTGGFLPPFLAAWGPNLLFAAAGIWLTFRVR